MLIKKSSPLVLTERSIQFLTAPLDNVSVQIWLCGQYCMKVQFHFPPSADLRLLSYVGAEQKNSCEG